MDVCMDDWDKVRNLCVPEYGVAYLRSQKCTLVSVDMIFSRDMRVVAEPEQCRKLVTLPRSAEHVSERTLLKLAFRRSVDMGRASEKLGEQLQQRYKLAGYVFKLYNVRHLFLPNGLREIGTDCYAYS